MKGLFRHDGTENILTVDISEIGDLSKEKGLKGTLIEIENSDECFVISLE